MRKYLFACLLLLLFSCKGNQKTSDNNTLSVSIAPYKYIVEAIAGDDFTVNVMVPAGASPHSYEPYPDQIKQLEKSSAYIANGYLDFETTWFDRFKSINDNYGHNEGDKGITIVGKAAAAITDKNEICVRSGGDEFCIIGMGAYDAEKCRDKEKKFSDILAVISSELSPEYDISASIGCVYAPFSYNGDIDMLIKEADAKMYEDKTRKKKNRN